MPIGFTAHVEDFGTPGSGASDDTALVQSALSSGATTVFANGSYRIDGTLDIPDGVQLVGQRVAAEYYPGGPGSATQGSTLYKTNAHGQDGPIVILNSGSGLKGLYLKHEKVGGARGGIVRVGKPGVSTYYAVMRDCFIYGPLTGDLTGATTSVGLYFQPGSVASTVQRYFNRFSDFHVTNCDQSIYVSNNCNGNTFSNFTTRQSYEHITLQGVGATEGCIENTFTGFGCFNIGALNGTTPIVVFKLLHKCLFNTFSGYATECYGRAFTFTAGINYNTFMGWENELIPAFPGGVGNKKY